MWVCIIGDLEHAERFRERSGRRGFEQRCQAGIRSWERRGGHLKHVWLFVRLNGLANTTAGVTTVRVN